MFGWPRGGSVKVSIKGLVAAGGVRARILDCVEHQSRVTSPHLISTITLSQKCNSEKSEF